MVKTARINTTSFSYSNIAKNGLVCSPGDLLTLVEGEGGQNYITLAKPDDIIWGVCDDRKTFSDENETKEKARVNYTPTAWDNTYKMTTNGDELPKIGHFYKITEDQKIDLSSESPSVGQLMVQDVNDSYIEVRFVTSQGLAVGQYDDVRLASIEPLNPSSDPFDGMYAFHLSNGQDVVGDFSAMCIWLNDMVLDNLKVKNLEVQEDLHSLGTTTTHGISNYGVIDTEGINAESGTINTLQSDEVTVNTKLESKGNTITNGIENTGDITTDTLTVKTKLESQGETITNGINNTGDIVNEGDITTNNMHVKNDLRVDGKTDLEELEVNGQAQFRDKVEIFDDFYVSGDTTLNGHLTVNGPETHNGPVEYNGDVTFNGKVSIEDLDIDVDLRDYQKKEEKGMVNGYASLDNTGKVPMSQLPNISGGITYKGGWNAGTGVYPANPNNGDMYYCLVGGTVNGIQYEVGDRIIYDQDDDVWDRLQDNYGVQSVNGRTGVVVDVQDTTDRKDSIDLVNPLTTKYISEKGIADLINSLLERIEELEEKQEEVFYPEITLPSTMDEGVEYTVSAQNVTADTHIIILDSVSNGNFVITPDAGFIKIISSANETNPTINILAINRS